MNDDILRRYPPSTHEHKWFIFQIKSFYDPTAEGMFIMREYAYSGCNCGEVVKIKVKELGDVK